MIGKAISHYQILEKLGEGGMGIVYKALDTRLNRTVALKVLPERVSQAADARARLLQEAQAAAGLNHGNICTIYGVEEFDGSLFIVMEYIEGGTLRERIPFAKPEDAVAIAAEIGDGLQEAHSKGIVHRDIKADNVMLTSRGQAKVMDFGLAKLKGALKLTRTSSTVGTLAYMAPEQIQGHEVDHRSDIFSFGVLLFEMLTGRLPFRGEHEAAMVYSIVNEEPQDISALVPRLSPIIANLIQRCLEKDPADRYQTMLDAVSELRRSQKKTSPVMRSALHRPPAAGDSPAPSVPMPAALTFSASRRRRVVTGVAVATVAVVAVAVWLLSRPSHPGINPNMVVSALQIPATEYQYPGISSDGRWLAFPGSDLNGNWDIYMMLIESGETERVTTDSSLYVRNSLSARFSPDGSSITYARWRRGMVLEICVVSVLSRLVRVIADTGISPQWSPTGDRIYYYRLSPSRVREYWSVSPRGGDARVEFVDSLAKGSMKRFSLCISPDGRKIAFTRPLANDYNEIFIRYLATGEEVQLTDDKKTIDEVTWADNGMLFYTSDKSGSFNVWSIPETGGAAQQVTRGAGQDYGISFSTAANRLVFLQRTDVATLRMVNTDGTGDHQVYTDENIVNSHIAPDGSTLALEISHPTLNNTLMVREISGGRQEILFPYDSAIGRSSPLWFPGGSSLSYVEYRPGNRHLNAKIIDIAGGRRVHDLGEGVVQQWVSDSVVIIARNSAADYENPQYSSTRTLDLYTSKESVFFRDTVFAVPVMHKTAILYWRAGTWRYLPMSEYRRDPSAEGRPLLNSSEILVNSNLTSSESWLYYRSAKTGALWRLDYRTFGRSKIIDIPPSTSINLGAADHNDKVITYSVLRQKMKIVKVDNVFLQ